MLRPPAAGAEALQVVGAGFFHGRRVPRRPAVAGLFYPSERRACLDDLERCWRDSASELPAGREAVAAVAPHAGWIYSGPTLAAAVRPLAGGGADTVLLFGAAHRRENAFAPTVYPGDSWGTPLGPVEVDREVARALAADRKAAVAPSEEAHAGEHSLEVLVPFVRQRLPGARIVPLITPPGCGAAAVGEAAVRVARALGRRAVAIGSSDLTHYGERYGFQPRGSGAEAHRWSKEENDAAILDRALALDPEGVERSAGERRNACGSGAMAATAAAARALGATGGRLLRHTTSAEVTGESDPDMWVGYAAVVYLA